MKKHIIDLRVTGTERVGAQCVLLRMVPVEGALPETAPGQFVQLRVDAQGVFLRRPISIHDVRGNEIDFLVQVVGEGTAWLGALKVGDTVNAVMPLGKGFTIEIKNEKLKIKNDGNENQNSPLSSLLRREWGLAPLCGAAATFSGYSKDPSRHSPLLVGGGVGVAPLLYLGRVLKERGVRPTFLLGARTKDLLLRLDAFREVGEVLVTTEDGSMGEKGFVTQHSIFRSGEWRVESGDERSEKRDERNEKGDESGETRSEKRDISMIQCCGPTPMMKAVAKLAIERGIACEVSLENRMACGVGACLCCVQETKEGHKCVCTDGPVFEARELVMG